MQEGLQTLTYAVRPKVLGRYLGQIGLMVDALLLAPLAASLVFAKYSMTWRFGLAFGLLLVICLPLARIAAPKTIQNNEALCIVALAFVLAPLAMAYPMAGAGLSFADALFESVSAVTTTGLTTVSRPEEMSPTFLFSRAWGQWYGGLGIVILSVALVMGHDLAARRIAEPIAPESLETTARIHARRMLTVYIALSAMGLLVVGAITRDSFNTVAHVLTAVSTGGFSTASGSLAQFDQWPARFALMGVALAGATPLPLYYRIYRRGWREVLHDMELRTLLLAIVGVTGLLWLFMSISDTVSVGDAFKHALLQGMSAQTGTGFSSMDVARLDSASKIVLTVSMSVGAGMGSTAGGIKILRLLIVIRLVQVILRRSAMPAHAVYEPRLGGRTLEADELLRALLLILLYIGVVLASWLIFIIHGYSPLDALFEVVSATGTVGLSSGITSSDLPIVLKSVLCIDMLLGRVEIVALLVVLYPPTWLSRRN